VAQRAAQSPRAEPGRGQPARQFGGAGAGGLLVVPSEASSSLDSMSYPTPEQPPSAQVEVVQRIERELGSLRELLADEDLTGALDVARWMGRDVAALERGLVRQARARGASWEVIGGALGVSRQGAHERYAGPDLD
jgi:hypothetical protein